MSAPRRGRGVRRRPARRRGALPRRGLTALGLLGAGALAGIALGGLAGVAGLARGPDRIGDLASVGAALDEHLRLRAIEVIGLRALEAEALVADLGLVRGTPLRAIDVEAVAARVSAHPRVATCRVLRIPPDRLLLKVEERRPAARLASGEGIDLTGARFDLVGDEGADLPRLEGEAESALPLFRAAEELGLQIERALATAPDDVRFRPAGRDVWVRVGPAPARALRDWLRLAETGLMAGGLVAGGRGTEGREVDLRFAGSAVLRGFEGDPRGERDVQN